MLWSSGLQKHGIFYKDTNISGKARASNLQCGFPL